ncbi:tRNA (adenosine(37)-N6)-threonylcarbamoyltransferase complex dimerization subunit type 1 TsaB [Vibrio sp.]|uniref:tRNA threonylcarbamoyladenosine biosynthesis protein TsaB n=1 Tax=Vibrio viridaestus TaxID=2487322 RepID=A0A3N9TH48_9VIBR|nr:tRNA (adenosine(37)-N6)-threonylcarbamoyltransferase complex dimerization subunit type 1 TsaB [Vibrio viridaestus]MDC0611546.1 tRNA (adenosine(37)-N6)-threonylcarbamoyltransferase complex dimerization subunit type 1 TsaB [Vibrio sp.]RQW63184.1 tRNA (adenosine(37)-N6)-threonylcarbamoyltransferase complex dimerization subunit type 1 TsaB [Vibrio viridaestus]
MSTKILAIDTSTENCSVALMIDEQCYVRRSVAPRDHTKKVLPLVDELLKEAQLTLKDLDALAFGCGPGSFTGVRIGIGIAQGLSFGADLPLIPVSTLKAMAQGCFRTTGAKFVAPAIDARMAEVYWARYARQDNGEWTIIDQEAVIAPQLLVDSLAGDSETWVSAGTGWETYGDTLSGLPFDTTASEVLYPDAEDIANIARFEWLNGNTVSAEDAAPVYLRDNVTWKKLPGKE